MRVAAKGTILAQPLFSERHAGRDSSPAYWYTSRQAASGQGDEGTDVFLSLVDLSARPLQLDYDVVHITRGEKSK